MSTPMLICYDGSPDADRAIDAAAELFPSLRAVVLDVAPVLTTAESVAAMSSVVPGTAFDELNESEALTIARAGAAYAERAGIAAEARGAVASPTWQGIVDVADEIDAAVIVIGSRGLRGLREFASGSVSHEVAVHANRPVLIIPPA